MFGTEQDLALNERQKAASLMIELAEANCFFSILFGYRGMKMKPGESFERLPEEKKSLLRKLQSEDIKNVRWPSFRNYAGTRLGRLGKKLVENDPDFKGLPTSDPAFNHR